MIIEVLMPYAQRSPCLMRTGSARESPLPNL